MLSYFPSSEWTDLIHYNIYCTYITFPTYLALFLSNLPVFHFIIKHLHTFWFLYSNLHYQILPPLISFFPISWLCTPMLLIREAANSCLVEKLSENHQRDLTSVKKRKESKLKIKEKSFGDSIGKQLKKIYSKLKAFHKPVTEHVELEEFEQ